MWNLKIIILAVFLGLFSLYAILAKPEMHKQLDITNSEYEFVDTGMSSTPINIENRKIVVEPYKQETKNVKVAPYHQPKRPVQPQTLSQQYKQVKRQAIEQTTKPQPTVQQQKPKQTNTVITQPKQETKTEQPVQQSTTTKPTLTEQEEIIARYKWRSRLQNQVMMDSKVAAPLGTQFKFSFTVDKYGNMSNVKVWSVSPAYSDYAVRVIKPVLMSYRNKPILNFPEGTKRIITNVEGGFVISRYTQYSTPADYHDYEKVKR